MGKCSIYTNFKQGKVTLVGLIRNLSAKEPYPKSQKSAGESGVGPAFGTRIALTNGETFPLAEIMAINEVPEILSSVRIYPNPVVATTTLALVEKTIQINVNIVNQEGRLMFTKALGQLTPEVYQE